MLRIRCRDNDGLDEGGSTTSFPLSQNYWITSISFSVPQRKWARLVFMHRSNYLFVIFLLLNEAHYRKETLPPRILLSEWLVNWHYRATTLLWLTWTWQVFRICRCIKHVGKVLCNSPSMAHPRIAKTVTYVFCSKIERVMSSVDLLWLSFGIQPSSASWLYIQWCAKIVAVSIW